MATATKVIAALRTAGLVETIPGSGTVVRHRSQPTAVSTRPAVLTQREIVQTAVRIADADGLPLVTMRRVADSLCVSTMALYRHVPNKADLTLRMADSVFARVRLPKIPMASWRRRLDAAAHLFWTVFGRHPWAAEVFSISRPQLMPNVLPLAEWSLSTPSVTPESAPAKRQGQAGRATPTVNFECPHWTAWTFASPAA